MQTTLDFDSATLTRIRVQTDVIRHRGHPLDDDTMLAWEAPSGNIFRMLFEIDDARASMVMRDNWDHEPSREDEQHYAAVVKRELLMFFEELGRRYKAQSMESVKSILNSMKGGQ
jgi:hypothetical protein